MCLSFGDPLSHHDLRLPAMVYCRPHDTICKIRVDTLWARHRVRCVYAHMGIPVQFCVIEKKREKRRAKNCCLRDCGVRWAADTATCQFLFLLLGGDNDAAGRNEWWLGWCENSQVVILLMNIISCALCLHTTFKTSIITIIRCICYAQIVNSLLGTKIDSVIWKERERF